MHFFLRGSLSQSYPCPHTSVNSLIRKRRVPVRLRRNEISACPVTDVASSRCITSSEAEDLRGAAGMHEGRSLASGERPERTCAHDATKEGAKSRDRTERGTHAQDEDHHCRFKRRRTIRRKRRGGERKGETDRIGPGRGGPWKSTGRRRVHIRRVFTVRLYRSPAAESGREGRAKERKERSFGVHRKVVEPGQPFGSRGAHNAAIVSRVHRSTLRFLPPLLVAPLRSPRPLRPVSRRNFDGPLRTGRLNFLFRDTCGLTSVLPFLSPRSCPGEFVVAVVVAAPRARLCWRRSPIPA